MDNVGYATPLRDVSTLERDELRCLIKYLSFSDDKLMERIDIHKFVIGTREGLLLLLFIHG